MANNTCAIPPALYRGDTTTKDFSFAFPYIKKQDIVVLLWDDETDKYQICTEVADVNACSTSTTEYYFKSDVEISFCQAPGLPDPERRDDFANVAIARNVDLCAMTAYFYPGTSIRAQDLNNNFTQVLLALQDTESRLYVALKEYKIVVEQIEGIIKYDDMQEEPYPEWTDKRIGTAAADKRYFETIVSTERPDEDTHWELGKAWLNITPGNQEFRIFDGSNFRTVAVGQPYSPAVTTIVRYVDCTNGSDEEFTTGFLPQQPLKTIKRAVELVNRDESDGTIIVVASGVYQEELPIQIQRKNISIWGSALRSVFVQPTQATETKTMFECNTGTLLANMTFVGLKASGARGGASYDSDPVYGLPAEQGWCAAFYKDCIIKKSPYVQNCTSFNDSGIDNSVEYDQTNLQPPGLGGDTTSAPTGGGILCDGATPSFNSPLRSFVVDSFTQINLDGPGILCTNNGYAQLVSFFGTFCHYHAKSLNGGQLNLSNCTTDFGRYGLVADGKSPTNIFTASADGVTAKGSESILITGTTPDSSWYGDQTNPQPLDNMLCQIGGSPDGTGGEIYPIRTSEANNDGYLVTIENPDPDDLSVNLGIKEELSNGTTVRFFLRSSISTGGHTFEFCGSGTDYSGHPDFGGVAIRANQTVNLNDGKVWQSSTDENGRFAVGETFIVNQKTGEITIPRNALNFVPQTGPRGSAVIPTGTTEERGEEVTDGFLRYNTDLGYFEGYANEDWSQVGGVNKIIAGTGVTISPNDGIGTVTINSSGGGGGGAVESVNSKTGVVVLNAADVGAATAEQGALADTALQPASPVFTGTMSGQSLQLQGKAVSQETSQNDPDTTLTTRSYVMPLDISILPELY